MKIRTKSAILFLGLSLVPLLVIGKFAYENGKEAIKKNLGLAFQQLAHTQIENVENNMEEVHKSVERWSKMSIMQEVVIGDMDATIQSFLLDVKKETKNFTHISVMNSEGAVIASTLPEMLGKDFRAARADKPRVDDVHYSGISGEWEMTFVFPIKAEFAQDRTIGSLMAGWNAAALSRMVRLSTEGETEEEVKGDEDRAIVAGILWKRLELGIPLQVDATLIYINGHNGTPPTNQDKIIVSPYNTYQYKGLPRGPIANPGISAIRAAVYPKTSSYLYYLSSKNGETIFSKTLEEHNRAKTEHLPR